MAFTTVVVLSLVLVSVGYLLNRLLNDEIPLLIARAFVVVVGLIWLLR